MTLKDAYVRLFDLAVEEPRRLDRIDFHPWEPHSRNGLLCALAYVAVRPSMLAAADTDAALLAAIRYSQGLIGPTEFRARAKAIAAEFERIGAL